MLGVVTAALLLNSVAALVPSTKVSTTTRLNAIQPFPENPTGIYGDIAPTGFFDPAGLSKGKDAAELKQWREAEIKHGRVCMLATAGILTQEIYQFLPFNIQGAGIHHFDLVDAKFPEFGELFILICAWIEGYSIQKFWEPRSVTKNLKRAARLRDDVEPGDLGFDPLGWYPSDPEEQKIIKTKELQNGRLAMLGFLGIVAQQLTDDKVVLCHFQKVCL